MTKKEVKVNLFLLIFTLTPLYRSLHYKSTSFICVLFFYNQNISLKPSHHYFLPYSPDKITQIGNVRSESTLFIQNKY